MGDGYIWFQPEFPETWKLPPGYSVEGIYDENGTFFHWSYVENGQYVAFGPDCKTKRQARRGAIDDHLARFLASARTSPQQQPAQSVFVPQVAK